jgi:hypothetical protein
MKRVNPRTDPEPTPLQASGDFSFYRHTCSAFHDPCSQERCYYVIFGYLLNVVSRSNTNGLDLLPRTGLDHIE